MKKSHKETLPIIQRVRDKVKESEVYKNLCRKYNVDIDYIDLIPMAFDDLDVSARTNQGCIYFNRILLEDGEFDKEDHYMLHEVTHTLQQTCGDGPTEGSTKDNYLDNKFEQDSFKAQTEYLSETRGDDVAEKYIEQVMDHHDVPKDEREDRRKDLLNLAADIWLSNKTANDEFDEEIPDFAAEFPKWSPETVEKQKKEHVARVIKDKKDTKELTGSGKVIAYHGGRQFEGGFSTNFIGSGEGMSALGPGIYFSTNKNLAKLYCKYVNVSSLYIVEIETSGLYNPISGFPKTLNTKLTNLINEVEKEQNVRLEDGLTLSHGQGNTGKIFRFFGANKARQVLLNAGIKGAWQKLPGGSFEIAVYDPSIVTIISKEECHSNDSKIAEAGLFKVPKAWVDRLEKEIIGGYAASVWANASDMLEQLNKNVKLQEIYSDSVFNSGPLNEFITNITKTESEWIDFLDKMTPDNDFLYFSADGQNIINSFHKALRMQITITKSYNMKGYDVNLEDLILEYLKYTISIRYPETELMKNSLDELSNVSGAFNTNTKISTSGNGLELVGDLQDAAKFMAWAGNNILESYLPYIDVEARHSKFEQSDVADLLFLIRECKQYTKSPVKLDNFKLVITLQHILEDLAKQSSEYIGDIDVKKYFHLIYGGLKHFGWPERIGINIYFDSFVDDGAIGMWSYKDKTMHISFDFPVTKFTDDYLGGFTEMFKTSVSHVSRTIRHELQHMAQFMLKDIKNLPQLVGLPSPNIRDPEVDSFGRYHDNKKHRIEHPLMDVEFYTDLTDSIDKFNSTASNWPVDLKTEYSKLFVGEPNDFINLIMKKQYTQEQLDEQQSAIASYLGKKFKPDYFFEILRKKNITKWKVAVREFAKAIK